VFLWTLESIFCNGFGNGNFLVLFNAWWFIKRYVWWYNGTKWFIGGCWFRIRFLLIMFNRTISIVQEVLEVETQKQEALEKEESVVPTSLRPHVDFTISLA
jgi:hypothetical protein